MESPLRKRITWHKMQTMESGKGYQRRLALQLLLPSWLSGFLCIVISLFVVAAVIGVSQFEGSTLQKQFFAWREANTSQSISAAYEATQTSSTLTAILDRVLLFGFWFLSGLIVYLFAGAIVSAIRQAREFKESLTYMHSERTSILYTALVHVAVRLSVLIGWVIFARIFVRMIIPYCTAIAHVAAGHLTTVRGIGFALLSFAILCASLHLQVIAMRLFLLRARAFNGQPPV